MKQTEAIRGITRLRFDSMAASHITHKSLSRGTDLYEKERGPVGRARAAVVMEDYADHLVRRGRCNTATLLVPRLVTARCAMRFHESRLTLRWSHQSPPFSFSTLLEIRCPLTSPADTLR